MHLITITRPHEGRWQSGMWAIDHAESDLLVLDHLPVFLSQPGALVCGHQRCIRRAQVEALGDWEEAAEGGAYNGR